MGATRDPEAGATGRVCDWCRGPIRPGSRRDAITCSTPCRQARARFRSGAGAPPPVDGGPALRLAYADPPYPGLSARYYSGHPDYAGEVDHAELIASLTAEFDGWALAAALPAVLRVCPADVRVASWHRGERPNPAALTPINGWEPVIWWGGRRYRSPVDQRRVDAIDYRPGARTTDPARVIGAKPAAVIRWVLDLLGALPGDELVDLFPGSGGVGRVWATWAERR